eukprot:gene20894-27084_t
MGNSIDDDASSYSGFVTSAPMPFARSDMKANIFNYDFHDGKGPRIYLIGGCIANQTCVYTDNYLNCACPVITNRCEYFTPDTEEWFPCASAPTNRYQHTTAFVNNKLYLAGGRTVPDDNLIETVDVYDPLTDSWSTPFNWTEATSDAVAFGSGDLLYLAGGYSKNYSTFGRLQSVNVNTGEWNSNYPYMKVGRGDIRVASIDHINYYVIGGFVADNFCVPSNVVESYNIETNTWTTKSSLLYARGDVSVGTIGDNIFAIGGETISSDCSHSIPVSVVSRYSIGSNGWEVENSSPEDLFRYTSESYNESTSISTRAIYLFGGQGLFVGSLTGTGYYPIRDYTIKYFPKYSHQSSETLSPGGIAGVVIGGAVFLIIVVFLVLTYIGYRNRKYFTREDIAIAKKNQFNIDEEQSVNEFLTQVDSSLREDK